MDRLRKKERKLWTRAVPAVAALAISAYGLYFAATQNDRRGNRTTTNAVPCLVQGYEKFLPHETEDDRRSYTDISKPAFHMPKRLFD